MSYLLLVSYDGTCFSGWQSQPYKRTVQSELEGAALALFGVPVRCVASGRTDAGVHALGQVVQFDAETSIPADRLAPCFNRLLPPDVRVRASAEAPEGFDCIRSAKRKTYLYSAYYAPAELPLLSRYAARLSGVPSVERMEAAARLLVGKHDFAAFRASGATSATSVRTLFSVRVSAAEGDGAKRFFIEAEGDGFLYNMVRILAGELFAVGCGRETGIPAALETGKRSCLAGTMPPQGLLLKKVDYGAPLFGAEQ